MEKHEFVKLVVYNEADKVAPKTLKAIEFAEQHYKKVEVLTVHEAEIQKLDLHSIGVMIDNEILKNVLIVKAKKKILKELQEKEAKKRKVSKLVVAKRRAKNKNKKTH